MRYDKTITFVRETEGTYNRNTGDYDDPEAQEVTRLASVVETSDEMMTLIYGKMKQGSITIHLQNPYTAPFSYIKYGDNKYRVDKAGAYRQKCYFVCSEVP